MAPLEVCYVRRRGTLRLLDEHCHRRRDHRHLLRAPQGEVRLARARAVPPSERCRDLASVPNAPRRRSDARVHFATYWRLTTEEGMNGAPSCMNCGAPLRRTFVDLGATPL